VLTLALFPVESHTAHSLKMFVKSVISEYLAHSRRMLLFNTTDGAANMKLPSKLLGHQRIDCTAHCLHLLLTVDSFNRVSELVLLAEKCKAIVSSSPSTAATPDSSSASCDSESAAKKMRRSLIQVLSQAL